MNLIKWIDLPTRGDERGSLVAIEEDDSVPFQVKRVYYIYGTQAGISRGFHAHVALKQLAVCVAGKCRMTLDNGRTKKAIWLDCPEKGVIIENMVWHEMHDFSPDCVLLVLASEHYDEADYVRDYVTFQHLAGKIND